MLESGTPPESLAQLITASHISASNPLTRNLKIETE
jgi:hypothetical protein